MCKEQRNAILSLESNKLALEETLAQKVDVEDQLSVARDQIQQMFD